MDIKSLRAGFINDLKAIYSVEEVRAFFVILSEKFLGFSRAMISLNLDMKLTDQQLVDFDNAKIKLAQQQPIQYIVGETNFFGLQFNVDSSVLIPRPETEELVDWILKDQKGGRDTISILDIGSGSGCIAISLAKNIADSEVYALDISEEAINTAKGNAKRNDATVAFLHADILETKALFQKFDVIVSNPPYVRELEKQEIKPNVLNNEPSQALFVADDNPLIFYKCIANLAHKYLNKKGVLYFEINQYLGLETQKMIEDIGFSLVELRQDLFGNDRMIRAEL
ncbi:peptide chain release factor N(5)-glutamine methyltransferase [Aquimarina pacifica]|uniref:peptide chain release factor N(5)-glutamine methyltransferase n=1 Tax=Aquimarina pacifica TaxID=1296415 RepID=UPI00046E6683|nr:peptide chain release factor N(5)-glutamine methyltransferase [Aquimarina pacifica]